MSSTAKISKLLIANRGEIACRVIRTAKELGIKTVAVYSEPDRHALHVKMADEAHCIGPAASQLSYLSAEKILKVAQENCVQAIHPGYGFLSENTEFAELCQQHGIIFVGPPSTAIRDMGIKNTSKEIMIAAGVPVIHGYHGANQNPEFLLSEARNIGFPVMIKAVRGGGGKGMRIALTEEQFSEQLESAKREAKKSFNDEDMLLEKYIETPRHVEVQVFGDQHGQYVYLFERDCSVQRRHQKILEEAPAPGISPDTRRSLGEAAVKAAKAVNYVGAGTVEFIMDKEENFFFMEMNTRLQVEHPITEMITCTDLVEWQLRVAAGEPLPLTQEAIGLHGHAFEARIYAEDCRPTGFMPTAGDIRHLSTPETGTHLRIDTGVEQGDAISVHYDPMIAKLVVWSHDRASALRRLVAALKNYNVVGLPTNIEFLQALGNHSEFEMGRVHTDFIAQHEKGLFPERPHAVDVVCKSAAAFVLLDRSQPIKNASSDDMYSPFCRLSGFRMNTTYRRRLNLQIAGKNYPATVEYLSDGSYNVNCENVTVTASGSVSEHGNKRIVELCLDGVLSKFNVVQDGTTLHVFDDGWHHEVATKLPAFLSAEKDDAVSGSDNSGRAPMPGVIEKVMVTVGQDVEANAPLVTLIAMKMEYTIRAAHAGRIASLFVSEGQTVNKNQELVVFEKEEEK